MKTTYLILTGLGLLLLVLFQNGCFRSSESEINEKIEHHSNLLSACDTIVFTGGKYIENGKLVEVDVFHNVRSVSFFDLKGDNIQERVYSDTSNISVIIEYFR